MYRSNPTMDSFVELTMTDGKKLFVDARYVAGIFENTYGDRTETVINMSSGAHYTVKERQRNVFNAIVDARG